jgi:hypothetical protein
MAIGLMAVGLAGCESNREFSCQVGQAGACVRDGVSGQCVSPGFCAFQDSSCDGTGLRYDSTASDELAGTCVDGIGAGDGGVPNMCGGTSPLPGAPGDACGVCGIFACNGPEALVCMGEPQLEVTATDGGTVEASTVFDDDVSTYGPQLAVDDELDSSWFSDGPASEMNNEAKYTWTAAQVDCISRVTVIGNGQNATQSFRENFGFAQLTVEIYEGSVDGANLRFSESVNLPGTPDPDAVVTPNVRGDIVRLVFAGHESNDCGGFGELIVNARR